jgi:hypothetical protein
MGLEDSVRTGVWAECARTTTFLSNITAFKAMDKCAYQLFRKPKLPKSVRIFGETGIIALKYYLRIKLKSRGLTCTLVGYSVDQANDV